jgi:hypothetical protein
VKGRQWRTRDLDVVLAEMEFLLDRGLRRFWLSCSELNIEGNALAIEIAERIIALKERRSDAAALSWSAYMLPKLAGRDELRTLLRSGYELAWNEAQSLDDQNLKATRVPYRSRDVVGFFKEVIALEDEGFAPSTKRFDLFLGNAHAEPSTLRNTLARIEEERLSERFESARIIPATRVFEVDGRYTCGTAAGLVQLGKKREHALLGPAFWYPQALLARFGSEDALHEMFDYVADTYLSRRHRANIRWSLFLAVNTTRGRFADFLEETCARAEPELPRDQGRVFETAEQILRAPRDALEPIFSPPRASAGRYEAVAAVLVELVALACEEELIPVLDRLGVAHEGGRVSLSSYAFAKSLYRAHQSTAALMDALALPESSLELFLLRRLFHLHNVVLRPDYKEALFDA